MSKKVILHVKNDDWCGIYEDYKVLVPDDFNLDDPPIEALDLADQLGSDLHYDYGVYEEYEDEEEAENNYSSSWEEYNEEDWGEWKTDYDLTLKIKSNGN